MSVFTMSYNAVYGLIPYSSQPHLQFLPLIQASQICCLLQSYQVYTFACVPPAWTTLSSHTYIALSFLSFRSFPWDYLSEDSSWPLFKIPESSSLELFLASFFALFFTLYLSLCNIFLFTLSCFLSVFHYTKLCKGGNFCLFCLLLYPQDI